MKTKKLESFFLAIFCIAIPLVSNAWPQRSDCSKAPVGLFEQVTNSSVQLSPKFLDTIWLHDEAELRAGRWTLDPLERVDPTYKLILDRADFNDRSESFAATGKLVAPNGDIFALGKSTYYCPANKLVFSTVIVNGISYTGEIVFFAEPKVNQNRVVEVGTATITAAGDALGKVTLAFPIASVRRG